MRSVLPLALLCLLVSAPAFADAVPAVEPAAEKAETVPFELHQYLKIESGCTGSVETSAEPHPNPWGAALFTGSPGPQETTSNVPECLEEARAYCRHNCWPDGYCIALCSGEEYICFCAPCL